MSDKPLEIYLAHLDRLADRTSAAGMNKLKRDLGRTMQLANRQRIAANIEPSGAPMLPRLASHEEGRKLKKNERLKPGQEFYYIGPHGKHNRRIRRLKNVKTPESAAAKTRADTAPYDPQYEWGYEIETRGVSKFNRDYIRVMDGKPRNGRIRELKERMFRKIGRAKYLKMRTSAEGASVYFSGSAASIAPLHQYGEGNRPERVLIGFSDEDVENIELAVTFYLTGGK